MVKCSITHIILAVVIFITAVHVIMLAL